MRMKERMGEERRDLVSVWKRWLEGESEDEMKKGWAEWME